MAYIHSTRSAAECRELAQRIADVVDQDAPSLLKAALVPGISFGVMVGNEAVELRTHGLADIASNRPVDVLTLFQIASSSKPVSAFGIAHLFESRSLSLDQPIEPLLKSWHFPERMRRAGDVSKISMRNLLTHTSGLNIHSYPWVDPSVPRHSAAQLLDAIDGPGFTLELILPPETYAEYSGAGITLAQLVAEDVAGESFISYMAREVFIPLGMWSSTYDETPWSIAQVATRHDGNGNPMPRAYRAATAASNLYSNPEDILRFIAAIRPGPHGEPAGRGLLSPAESLASVRPQPRTVTEPYWGLAWYLGHGFEQTTFKAGGAKEGVWTWIEGFPRTEVAIAMMTNGEAGQRVTKPLMSRIRPLAFGDA